MPSPPKVSTLTPDLIAALNRRGGRGRASRGVPRDTLLAALRYAGLPTPELEYRFAAPRRKWALDLAYPDPIRLGIEIEGLVYSNRGDNQLIGRHVSVTGYHADLEKYNELAIMGWRLLRVTSAHATNGTALTWIERALREAPL